jgi:hypothetical protein
MSAVLSERVGSETPAPFALPDAERRLFAERGFLALERLMPPAEVATTRATLERLFDSRAGYAEGARFDFLSAADDPDKPAMPQILRPSVYAPALLRSAAAAHAATVARALLGPEARLAFDHVMVKPPHDGAATPWHQDDAFADPAFDMRSVTVWIPLQPVDARNGCLAFIPGAPDRDVLPHRSPGGDGRVHGLECAGGFSLADAIPCPIPAGGCTVHSGRTLHGAGANLSDAPRYAFALVFSTPKRPAAHPQPRPWLDGRETARDRRERRWMRRGGLVLRAWRRLARMSPGELRHLGPELRARLTRR